MPDTKSLGKHFGRPAGKRRVGFPVMHTLMLMDAATGFFLVQLAGGGKRMI